MSNDVTPTTTPAAPAAPTVTTAPLPSAPAPMSTLSHDTRQANIIICGAFCFGIAALFVALRFYTRTYIIRALGPTDWSILVALAFSAATTAGLIEQAVLGSGRHVWDLDPTDISSGKRWGRSAWMGVLFYLLTLCFSKVSILLLYIHIFAFKWARTAGQILLGIVIVSHIYMLIITCTMCIPLQSYWDWDVEKKYCHGQRIWWGNTGMHMVTDFLIFLIPMPVVWSIMLPRKQKIMLFGVFGLGFIVCFISILRLLQLLQVENESPDPDFTWAAVELSYLTAVEVNGAIVVACVMTLKPFLVRHFPSLLNSGRGSSSSSSSNSAGSPTRGGPGGGGRRGSENIMGRPPTIGSRPSKMPMSPVDSDLMVSKSRASIQLVAEAAQQIWKSNHGENRDTGTHRGNRDSTGYLELDDDSWVVDVEMAEGIGKRSNNRAGGGDESDGTVVARETGSESDRPAESSTTALGIGMKLGVEKKNSTRSNDSDGTTLRPTNTDTDTDGKTDGLGSVSKRVPGPGPGPGPGSKDMAMMNTDHHRPPTVSEKGS